jgi:hypothetical protein
MILSVNEMAATPPFCDSVDFIMPHKLVAADADSVLQYHSPGSELNGKADGASTFVPVFATTDIYRMAWGETYTSAHVQHIEVGTFEALFEKICEKPSVTGGCGPYVCAPMCDGIRSAKNAEPTRILMVDYDELSPTEADQLRDAVDSLGVMSVIWPTGSSTPTQPRRRVMVALSAPVSPAEYPLVHKAFASDINFRSGVEITFDPSSSRAEQPQCVPLAKSDIAEFFGPHRVPFDVSAALKKANKIDSGAISTQASVEWLSDEVVVAAKKMGLCPTYVKPGTIGLTCPWVLEHTGTSSTSSSAILLPGYEGRKVHGYKCLHAHCIDRGIKDLRAHLGIAKSGEKKIELSLQPIPGEWLEVALPPKEWVVEGLIPLGTVGLLVAEGGTGKTMLSLRLAMAVAGGQDLFGIPTRHGIVVILGLEDPEDVLRRRVKAIYDAEFIESTPSLSYGPICTHYKKNLTKRLVCKSLVGSELHLLQTGSGGAEQSDRVEELISKLKSLGPIELLILDPLSRLHGLEENDNSVGTALINAAERIAQEIGCAVLITHHTGKGNSKDREKGLYSARGSSALADAARTVLRLITADAGAEGKYSNISSEEMELGRILNLVHAKSNYGPRAQTIWLKREDSGITRFEPTSGNEFHAMWEKFASWWTKYMSSKPVFKSGLTSRRKEIWGTVTQEQVALFIQRGIDEDRFKLVGNAGAKNPSSQALLPIIS